MSFERNVFINCPFDPDYRAILKSIIFCLVYLDYTPLLSESGNAAVSRIDGIRELMKDSRLSIHDISRMKSGKKNELARFNMPFELGMDYAARFFGDKALQTKCLLVLDEQPYRYKQVLSDLSGNDIEYHEADAQTGLRKVRNWIQKIEQSKIDSGNAIWTTYNEFTGDFKQIAVANELSDGDIDDMPWNEYITYIQDWVSSKRS